MNPTIVVVMVDGWRARSLGAYGNTWFSTPAFDDFASQSLVLDRYLAESDELGACYRSLWTGTHAINSHNPNATSLIQNLATSGYVCELVTDAPEVASHPLAAQFEQVTAIDTTTRAAAAEAFDTSFGRVLEGAANVAGEWSSEYEQPRMLWVHLHGFQAAWDAPPELAGSLVDEEDPQLTPGVDVPQAIIDDQEASADEVFLASCRYAGQVMALDRCFCAFDRLLGELWPDAPPTVVLGGVRGFALGEHSAIGQADLPYSEQFHVPLIVRLHDRSQALQRDAALVQAADLPAMVTKLAEGHSPTMPARRIASGQTAAGSRFLQTGSWHFVQPSAKAAASELYVKPDDQWEANDVASLCTPEIDHFTQTSTKIGKLAKAGSCWRDINIESPGAQPSE